MKTTGLFFLKKKIQFYCDTEAPPQYILMTWTYKRCSELHLLWEATAVMVWKPVLTGKLLSFLAEHSPLALTTTSEKNSDAYLRASWPLMFSTPTFTKPFWDKYKNTEIVFLSQIYNNASGNLLICFTSIRIKISQSSSLDSESIMLKS